MLIVLLYFLSVGPAVRFGVSSVMLSGMRPSSGVGRFWRPVLALEETPVRPMFRVYMQLWGVTYHDAVDAPVVD